MKHEYTLELWMFSSVFVTQHSVYSGCTVNQFSIFFPPVWNNCSQQLLALRSIKKTGHWAGFQSYLLLLSDAHVRYETAVIKKKNSTARAFSFTLATIALSLFLRPKPSEQMDTSLGIISSCCWLHILSHFLASVWYLSLWSSSLDQGVLIKSDSAVFHGCGFQKKNKTKKKQRRPDSHFIKEVLENKCYVVTCTRFSIACVLFSILYFDQVSKPLCWCNPLFSQTGFTADKNK